jgi:hypothetical protein
MTVWTAKTRRMLPHMRTVLLMRILLVLLRCYEYFIRRPQWQRDLRRRSAATRLLKSWVRIPLGAQNLSVVNVVCCQLEVSATIWSLVQRIPTNCGASWCVISKTREWRGLVPLGGCRTKNKQQTIYLYLINARIMNHVNLIQKCISQIE